MIDWIYASINKKPGSITKLLETFLVQNCLINQPQYHFYLAYWLSGSPPQRQADMQLINATLDVYMRIFSSILLHSHHKNHSTTPTSGLLDHLLKSKRSEVTLALKELQQFMKDLRSNLNRWNNDTEDVLSKLNKIKVITSGYHDQWVSFSL